METKRALLAKRVQDFFLLNTIPPALDNHIYYMNLVILRDIK